MIGFRHILYPVDFSAQSKAAAGSVAAMARRFGSGVTLLHVADAGTPEADVRTRLERFTEAEFPNTAVAREILQGDPASQIVRFAEERGIDLIMMPTHGHGPFRALLLGSVTAKVLHDTHCAIWTGVHAGEIRAHSPGEWKQMLCAVNDADESDVRVIRWAAQFAREQGAALRLVHAVAGTEAMWTLGADPSMVKFLFDSTRARLADLEAKAGTAVEIDYGAGPVGSVLRDAARERNADLIVTGRRVSLQQFGAVRSSAYAIIRESPCAVISI